MIRFRFTPYNSSTVIVGCILELFFGCYWFFFFSFFIYLVLRSGAG
jgi:hypothetical protein